MGNLQGGLKNGPCSGQLQNNDEKENMARALTIDFGIFRTHSKVADDAEMVI